MNYIIATSRKWYEKLPTRLGMLTKKQFILIDKKEELNFEKVKAFNPRYIFFPHWSYIVPEEIYNNFECVIFHMTDVPFGRGGSPLQNLIARGVYETKITALKCVSDIDAGPVYMKRPFFLYGTAEEIYLRAAKVVEEMIIDIVSNEPVPTEQKGEIIYFERRKPEEGDISELATLEQVFDYIRMLDADGYPRAFLETGHFRLEFQRPAMKYGSVISDVIITKKTPNE